MNSKPKKTPGKYLMVFLGFFGLVSAAGCGGGGGGGNATPGNPVSIGSVTPSQKDQGYRTEATLHICRYGVSSGSYITILWGDQAQPTQGERSDWTSDGCRDYVHYFYKNGDFPYTVTGVNPAVNGGTGTFKVTVTPQNNPTVTLTGLNCPSPVYLNQKAACTATTSNGQGTVEINFGESNRQPVAATSGVPAEFSYNSTGTFTVTAVMSGIGGTPMTTAIQVVPSPASNLRTPTFASGFVLRPVQLGTSMCFSLGNLSSRTKSVRVQNGTTHEYSYGGQNPFSVCPPLTGEGHTDFSFRAIGNPGEMSDPLTTSVEHFSQNPLPALPDVFCDIDPNNNAQALCEVTKYLGFELWVRPPGGTDSLVPGGGRSSAYTGTDYLNQVTLTHPVALQGTTGAQSICFFHRLDGHIDQSATTRKSTELCRTVNTVNNGGGNGNQTGQNPPICAGFVVSPTSGNTSQTYTATLNLGGTCTDQRVSWGDGTPDFVDSNCSQTTTTHLYTANGNYSPTIFRNNSANNGGSCQQTVPNPIAVGTTGGTGTGGTFAYTSEWLSHELEDLATDGTYLYGVNSETGCIYKYNTTGTAQGSSPWCGQVSGMPSGDGLSQPTAITHCNGELIVGDINRRKLFRFNTSGGYIGQITAVPPNSPGFNAITGLGCGTAVGTTKLMVADYSNNRIYVYDATTWGPQWSGSVSQATDAAMDQNGIIYGLSRGGSLERFTNSGGALTSIASGMSLPTRITITSYTAGVDTLLITENGNSRILVKDVSGATTTTFGGAGNTGGQTSNPSGAVVIGGQEFISVISSTTTDRGRVISF